MSSQVQRIQKNCAAIWGAGDYEIDIETDDYESYQAFVKRDYGDSYGPLLMMTPLCDSDDHAWDELDRMLTTRAEVSKSGANVLCGGGKGKERTKQCGKGQESSS